MYFLKITFDFSRLKGAKAQHLMIIFHGFQQVILNDPVCACNVTNLVCWRQKSICVRSLKQRMNQQIPGKLSLSSPMSSMARETHSDIIIHENSERLLNERHSIFKRHATSVTYLVVLSSPISSMVRETRSHKMIHEKSERALE